MATKLTAIDYAGATLTIDLGAIVANWRDLGAHAPGAECSACVKADAYGCGTAPVIGALSAAGCRTFFVAHIDEAIVARAAAPDAAIYVLNGLLPATAPVYASKNLRPVLGSVDELDEWRQFCLGEGWEGEAALHVDTGMHRLGLTLDEALHFSRPGTLPPSVTLLMSHLASADDPADPLNARQIGRFRELRSLFPQLRASLANSSGIFLGPDVHHELLRPGAALYGVNPTPGHLNPMRPVVRLDARVIQVRQTKVHESVGYGGAWLSARPSRIAVISVGYADGYPRSASSSRQRAGGDAIVAGHRCPIAGRVSMDLIAIDVTDVPEGRIKRGDTVALLDAQIDIDALAAHAGTIGYEVLTRLGRRYHRAYTNGS